MGANTHMVLTQTSDSKCLVHCASICSEIYGDSLRVQSELSNIYMNTYPLSNDHVDGLFEYWTLVRC
jgi:hypothetical protein